MAICSEIRLKKERKDCCRWLQIVSVVADNFMTFIGNQL